MININELTLEELAEKMNMRVSTLLNYLDFNNFLISLSGRISIFLIL